MFCPDCQHEMMIVTLGTTPPVKLNTCSYCGGVWTDQSETNFINQSDLAALTHESVRLVKPLASRLCPKDHTTLVRFRGESIPDYISVYRCDTCGGNWFPNGNLRKFKKAQSTKLSFFKTWHIPLPSAYAILLPVFLTMIITGGLIITVRSIQDQQQLESQAKGLVGKPVVRSVSPTEVFISFTTQKPVTTSLTYWNRVTPKKTVSVTIQPKTTHTIRLSDLSFNTIYSYQITLETITTEVFTFTTK